MRKSQLILCLTVSVFALHTGTRSGFGDKRKLNCWEILALMENRPNISVVAHTLEAQIREDSRFGNAKVLPSSQDRLIIVAVRKARQVWAIDNQFALSGFNGYAVVPEITDWPHSDKPRPTKWDYDSPRNNRRNRDLYLQTNLLTYQPEALDLLLKLQPIPYTLLRPPSPESKLSQGARAMIAHHAYSRFDRWMPEQQFTLLIEDPQLHWHYVNDLAYPITGETLVTEADLKVGAQKMFNAFQDSIRDSEGVKLLSYHEVFGGSGIRCLVQFSNRNSMRRTIAPRYVTSVGVPNEGVPGVDF